MKKYERASDVEKIAVATAIPQWHAHLRGVAIAYLFTEEIGNKNGKEVLAKIRKATPTEAHFGNVDAVLIVSQGAWGAMSGEQRTALVDHELCHLAVDDGRVTLLAHDVEEFAAVIKRHGLWKGDLIKFREDCGQMDLFAAGSTPARHGAPVVAVFGEQARG